MADTPPDGERYWQASDGKWYPRHLHPDSADQRVAMLPPATPEGTVRGSGCRQAFLIILTVGLIGFAIVAGLMLAAAAEFSTSDDDPAFMDVVVASCGEAPVIEITNHSSKRSNYLVVVDLEEDGGDVVGQARASADDVAPKQKVRVPLEVTSSAAWTDCELATVDRVAAP